MNEAYINETAIVDKGAVIGEKTRIWHHCHIMPDVSVGSNCNLGENVFLETGVNIGNNVKIKNNVAIYSGVTVEDDVFIGPNVVFTNVINPRSFIERKKEFKKTIIRKGASIGANATIVCGHEIGKFAFVGAGAVVTKDIPPYVMVVGNPARFHSYVCECGNKLDDELKCKVCSKQYKLESKGLVQIK